MAATRFKVFLDSSVLFAGIWSLEGGARMILKLGEAGVIQLMVSSLVLTEVESALRDKAPGVLGALSLILHRSNILVISEAAQEIIQSCNNSVHHPGDALILAAAWGSHVDYFVTLDRKHFLDNRLLRDAVPFLIGTLGDFLAWFKGRVTQAGNSYSVV